MIYVGTVPSGDLRVCLDEETKALLIEMLAGSEWVHRETMTAPNLRILAEWLSDAVGYGNAVALLTEWNVPPENPLWTLNHKGGETYWTQR